MKIKPPHLIGLAMVLLAVSLFFHQKSTNRELPPNASISQANAAMTVSAWGRISPLQYQQQMDKLEERIKNLTQMQEQLAKQEKAMHEMPLSRRQVQLSTMGAWSSVIRTNFTIYEELRQRARHGPKGVVPCTICDGYSYMPCVMSKGPAHHCVTCNGTGKRLNDDLCATCLGTGKCYLCNGRGKMFCPFCDDGLIDIRWPLPSYFPPPG